MIDEAEAADELLHAQPQPRAGSLGRRQSVRGMLLAVAFVEAPPGRGAATWRIVP